MANDIEFLEDGNSILAWQDIETLEQYFQKVYKTRVFDEEFCNEIVNECEKLAKNNLVNPEIDKSILNSEGWYSRSDPLYRVNIMPFNLLDKTIADKIQLKIQQLFKQCAEIYNLDSNRFKLKQGEIIKYSCNINDSCIKLREHTDDCKITFNVSLCNPGDFIGGAKFISTF